jgi:hypothetical protein
MNRNRYLGAVVLLICAILTTGVFSAISITKHIDKSQRSGLLREAQQASLLVSYEDLLKLSASTNDLESETYKKIKKDLTVFRSFDDSIRFVYILGYRPEIRTQFFYVDSEPENSPDYSPPGQLFTDTREKDIEYYLKAEAYTDGPYKDSWGEWISGYAPIKNGNGDIVGLVGIDTATSVWHEQINFVRVVVSLISVLFSILTILIGSLINKKQKSIDNLKVENKTLIHKENKFKELQIMAQVSRLVCYFPEEKFSFDEQFSKVLSIKENESIGIDKFLSYIHHDDKQKFNNAIDNILKSDISYTWFDIRIGTEHSGFRMYHIYGNIERNELLAPKRFSGIIQDINDIHT